MFIASSVALSVTTLDRASFETGTAHDQKHQQLAIKVSEINRMSDKYAQTSVPVCEVDQSVYRVLVRPLSVSILGIFPERKLDN